MFLPGLEDVVYDELTARFPQTRDWEMVPGREDSAAGAFTRPLGELLELTTVVAPFLVLSFPVSGPRGLLGGPAVERIAAAMREVRALQRTPSAASGPAPASFRIEAAGSDSPVMRSLAAAIAQASGMAQDPDGVCVLRVRPTPGASGWDVLVRIGARPLSARDWRVRGYPAAANATIAAAMVRLSGPRPADRVANLMCGSGTLLIERLLAAPARVAVGVDCSASAVAAAEENLAAAGLAGRARVLHGDIAGDEWGEYGPYDVLLADPPWGDKSGRHEQNEAVHRDLLDRAYAFSASDARLLVLTHEIKIMERVLAHDGRWRAVSQTRVFQKGHHPRIYVLRRV